MKRNAIYKGAVKISAPLAVVLALGACAPPGGGQADDDRGETSTITEPVSAEEIAELGDVELTVWAEAGEEETLDLFIPEFEERYPNVTVTTSIRSIDDLVTTVVNALNGDNAPDVAQGNQGFATDAALVEAGLIRPLDDVAEAYGWSSSFNQQLLGPLMWEPDGSEFRSGNLYGVSPVANNIGIFYNEEILDDAGVDVPETFEDMEDALEAVKDNGDLPLMVGNAEKWPALHVYGGLLGMFAEPDEVNEWVSGAPGASFETEGNREAAEVLVDWVDNGYLGDAYNSIGVDDAAARFGSGEGAFMIAGDWYAPAVAEGGGDQFGFMAPPQGPNGSVASIGSVSFPWHVSSKTDLEPAAIAFVAEMNSPDNADLLAEVNRIPVNAEVDASEGLAGDLIAVNDELMAADGQIDYPDWSTPTLYSVFGDELQNLMAKRITSEEFLSLVQAEWDDFHGSEQ